MERIKEYLNNLANNDEIFAKKFSADFLENVNNYIMKQAKEYLNKKQYGYISDEVVYKWARDYFNDEIYIQEEEERKQKELEKAERLKKSEEERKQRELAQAERLKESEEQRKQKELEKIYQEEDSLFFGME